jgi:hypothetical protein
MSNKKLIKKTILNQEINNNGDTLCKIDIKPEYNSGVEKVFLKCFAF